METNDSNANENERIVREAISKLNEHFQGSCRLEICKFGRYACYYPSISTIYLSPRAVNLSTLAHEYAHYLRHMRMKYRFYIESMKKDIRILEGIIKSTQRSIKEWNFSTNQNPINLFARDVGKWRTVIVKARKKGHRRYHDDEFVLCLYEVIKFLYDGDVNRFLQEKYELPTIKKKLLELAEKNKKMKNKTS
jgi:hypothetical protein